jgi:hypothetical protein
MSLTVKKFASCANALNAGEIAPKIILWRLFLTFIFGVICTIFLAIFDQQHTMIRALHLKNSVKELHDTVAKFRALQTETSYFPEDLEEALDAIIDRERCLPKDLIDDIYKVLENVRRGRRRVIHYTLDEFEPAGISEGVVNRVVAYGRIDNVSDLL